MQEPRQIQSVPSSPVLARNHICPTCNKPFQTASHLMRHARVHSTQRAHPCPFPGCQTRCSRKDNLQQHYRIHLSPGAKRRPGRVICVSKTPLPSVSPLHASPSPRDSPPLTPPPLADSRLYYLRIGAITKEQFDEMPINLGSPRDVAPSSPPTAETAATQPDPNRWRQLPPLDTRLATNGLGTPVPLTSSMSAGPLGASPYWGRSANSSAYSSAYTSPVGPYPGQQQLSPTLAQSSSTYTYNYAEQHPVYPPETQYSTEANVLAHADAFRRIVPSGNTLGLSTVQEPTNIPVLQPPLPEPTTIALEAALQPPPPAPAPLPPTLHAPHPVRVYMPLIEPEQEPTPTIPEPVALSTAEYDPGLYYPDPRVGLGRGAATPSTTLASDSPETEHRYQQTIYHHQEAYAQSQPVHEDAEQYYQQAATESSSYSPEQHSTPPAATPYAVYDPQGYYRIPTATVSAGNSPTAHSHAHSPYSVRHHPYRRIVPYQAPQAQNQAVYGYEPPPTGPVYSEPTQAQQRRHSYPVQPQPVATEYHQYRYSHYQAVS